jgi:DcuC family C4-dicarboxylate transporter
MLLLFAVALIVAAAVLTARGWDVRLVLLAAAVLLGLAGGYLPDVSRKFFDTFSGEAYVIPICSAMGFAYVLKLTECDQHLVRVLVAPVRRVRFLIVPGVVLAGFVLNVPVLSQTSVSVCLGAVVVPVMRAAGFHPLVIGAALLLGASVGGELFNPGAPELNTVSKLTGTSPTDLARVYLPWVVVPQLVVSTLVFWALTKWWWKSEVSVSSPGACDRADVSPSQARGDDKAAGELNTPLSMHGEGGRGGEVPKPINWLKAAVPLVPLVLLLVSGPPLKLLDVSADWLALPGDEMTEKAAKKATSGRLVGLAMVIGAAVAAATSPRQGKDAAKAFFEGAGYGFANIVSLIVVAVAFGTAVEKAGFKELVGQTVTAAPWLIVPLAVLLPWAFAVTCGSGMASTASLYGFFHQPDAAPGVNEDVGALVSIGSAAGRTMSPVAAVAVMCGKLTDTTPWALAGRVAVPLLAGLAVVIVLRMCGVV